MLHMFTFCHSRAILQCFFISLISVKVSNGSYVFSILDSVVKFFGKKVYFTNLLICLKFIRTEMDRPDPERHALDADTDPAQLCRSDPIPIQIGKIFAHGETEILIFYFIVLYLQFCFFFNKAFFK